MKRFLSAVFATIIGGCAFGVTFAPKEYVDNLLDTTLPLYLRNDKANNEVQIFGGYLSGFGFHADTGYNDNGWNQYTAHNGRQLSQSLPDYISSNPWGFAKYDEVIPSTGGVVNVASQMHFTRLSVGVWPSSYKPIETAGSGSGAAFVFGDGVQSKRSNTITLGTAALNTNDWSFIWSGDANRYFIPTVPSMSNPYSTRYNGGFHINPSVRSGMTNPLQNFWIGDTNLNDWIITLSPPADVSGKQDVLPYPTNAIPTDAIDYWFDQKRDRGDISADGWILVAPDGKQELLWYSVSGANGTTWFSSDIGRFIHNVVISPSEHWWTLSVNASQTQYFGPTNATELTFTYSSTNVYKAFRVNGRLAFKSEVDSVAEDLVSATNGLLSASAGQELGNIVSSWEGYWGGTNVIFEVTNYYGNTSGEIPRLRIKELRNNVWHTVWDEIDKFNVCETNIMTNVTKVVNAAVEEANEYAKTNCAPLAWGTVTDKGSPNVVGNSVWMTAPETYFAGGTEYQRVAVGSGTICVLVDNGAGAYTTGEEGTFRFQDAGGTNYFGFAKSDSYTIGCRTDGITVESNLVTLRYDVIMGGSDVPIVYWRLSLGSGEWVQLNNTDGTAADGAPYTVTWYTSGGSYYAAINCGSNASGFFKAETSVAGDVVFETNMKARLGGGIECVNTQSGVTGVIRPTYNGSTVNWTWSAK